ncbi:nucleotidyl transferase AbiEii/AbiGii toxin family protein [Rhizobium pisi]|uniref:nucleotidyl transferase AbiEii/AbiGii toxin family protein n=1 Tax=Rhizobium pisi TaxID=574561 RepID=UPI003D071A42
MTAQAATTGDRVASKLKDHARNARVDVPQYLQKYVQERIMARLFATPQAEHMMVTGGVMYNLDADMLDLGRSTSDIDLQIFRATTTERLLGFVHKALMVDLDDGVEFVPGKYQLLEHSDLDQPGLRIHTPALIGKTAVATHIDFSVAPKPSVIRTLQAAPMIKGQQTVAVQAQTWASSIAEKLHSICKRGMTNTRLKDYRDLYVLAQRGHASDPILPAMIAETFANRSMQLPDTIPAGLDFIYGQYRQVDWEGYLAKLSPMQREGLPVELQDVTAALEAAYLPSLVPTDDFDLDEALMLRA